MNPDALSQFLSEDGDTHTRRLLLDAVRDGPESDDRGRKAFSFNRFIVILAWSPAQNRKIGEVGEPASSLRACHKISASFHEMIAVSKVVVPSAARDL
jgi:hypothetical protein